jgi:hypothetical protein
MHTPMRVAVAAAALLITTASLGLAQHPGMPPGMTHEEHLAQIQKDKELKTRGAEAMGFDQATTSHHFLLAADGGRIEVGVNDPADEAGRAQIRRHLKDIAEAFARGDFAKPFASHGEVPPGVATMRRRRAVIAYTYEETPAGGRVRISSSDRKATRAVHAFLTYQIREHATGDPLPSKR